MAQKLCDKEVYSRVYGEIKKGLEFGPAMYDYPDPVEPRLFSNWVEEKPGQWYQGEINNLGLKDGRGV